MDGPLEALETLRQSLPDYARDIKLNLQAVLSDSSLDVEQRWGVAVAAALSCGNAALRDATLADARRAGVSAATIEDGTAAAVLMAMNNVYYRFRHQVGKASYSSKPARLRMGRIAQPAGSKVNFELFSLAVSGINGCEACIRAHEKVVTESGLSEDQVNDAVRIASTLRAVATALGAMV